MNDIDQYIRDIEEYFHNEMKRFDEYLIGLGLPSAFLQNILLEDDWSFIVKISAIIEAATVDVLTKFLGHPEIMDCISYTDQSNPRSGRLTFLKKLKIIDDKQYKFLKQLSEIRNLLAHGTSHIDFSLEEYLGKLDKQQRKNWRSNFDTIGIVLTKSMESTTSAEAYIDKEPKQLIWIATNNILLKFRKTAKDKENERSLTKIQKKFADINIDQFLDQYEHEVRLIQSDPDFPAPL